VIDGFFEVDTAEAMADIYVWLRYSASRQLTWQRNYNTQPRILSAAQVGTMYVMCVLIVHVAAAAAAWLPVQLVTCWCEFLVSGACFVLYGAWF
jgi:alpha-glucan,water dikinase